MKEFSFSSERKLNFYTLDLQSLTDPPFFPLSLALRHRLSPAHEEGATPCCALAAATLQAGLNYFPSPTTPSLALPHSSSPIPFSQKGKNRLPFLVFFVQNPTFCRQK